MRRKQSLFRPGDFEHALHVVVSCGSAITLRLRPGKGTSFRFRSLQGTVASELFPRREKYTDLPPIPVVQDGSNIACFRFFHMLPQEKRKETSGMVAVRSCKVSDNSPELSCTLFVARIGKVYLLFSTVLGVNSFFVTTCRLWSLCRVL